MRMFENYFVFFTSTLRMIFVTSDDGTLFCNDTQLNGNNVSRNTQILVFSDGRVISYVNLT